MNNNNNNIFPQYSTQQVPASNQSANALSEQSDSNQIYESANKPELNMKHTDKPVKYDFIHPDYIINDPQDLHMKIYTKKDFYSYKGNSPPVYHHSNIEEHILADFIIIGCHENIDPNNHNIILYCRKHGSNDFYVTISYEQFIKKQIKNAIEKDSLKCTFFPYKNTDLLLYNHIKSIMMFSTQYTPFYFFTDSVYLHHTIQNNSAYCFRESELSAGLQSLSNIISNSNSLLFLLLIRTASILRSPFIHHLFLFEKIITILNCNNNDSKKILCDILSVHQNSPDFSFSNKKSDFEYKLQTAGNEMIIFSDNSNGDSNKWKISKDRITKLNESVLAHNNNANYAVITNSLNKLERNAIEENLLLIDFNNISGYTDLYSNLLHAFDYAVIKHFILKFNTITSKSISYKPEKFKFTSTRNTYNTIISCFSILNDTLEHYNIPPVPNDDSQKNYICRQFHNSENLFDKHKIIYDFMEILYNKVNSIIDMIVPYSNECISDKPAYIYEMKLLLTSDFFNQLTEFTLFSYADRNNQKLFEYLTDIQLLICNDKNDFRIGNGQRRCFKAIDINTMKAVFCQYNIRNSDEIEQLIDNLITRDVDRNHITKYIPPLYNKETTDIQLGTDWNNRPVYWSLDNKEMTNHHMLIRGNTGSGKSYFLIKLAKELNNKGYSVIFFDNGRKKHFDINNKLNLHNKGFSESNTVIRQSADIDDIRNSYGKILINLDNLPDKLISEKFLSDVWDFYSENEKELFMIFDESINLDMSTGSIINQLITQGRKSGVNLIISTQIIQGTGSQNINRILEQCSIKISFKTDSGTISSIMKSLNISHSHEKEKFRNKMNNLKKGYFMVYGELENTENKIENNQYTILKTSGD